MSSLQQFCTFYVAGQYCGLDAVRVQEIIRAQPMTPVPLAPPMVRGLINLRGQIVTAIDLRQRLGLDARTAEGALINVVVQTDDGAVSLLVDEIGDVADAPREAFEKPPETLSDAARAMIQGAYKLNDRLLLILDTDEVVRLETEEE